MDKTIKVIFMSVAFIGGIVLLASVSWKVAVGVFLVVFSHNIEKHVLNSKGKE